MTTIAYRDGVMAADSASFAGWGRAGAVRKIARNDQGDLAGASGSATYMGAFLRWFMGGENGDPPEAKYEDGCSDNGLIVRRDGQAIVYEKGGQFDMAGSFFALGSGGAEARGAMYAGASPFQAVCASIELDAFTRGPVVVLTANGMNDGTYPAPEGILHR